MVISFFPAVYRPQHIGQQPEASPASTLTKTELKTRAASIAGKKTTGNHILRFISIDSFLL